jgi:hypothetical protein
MLLMGNVLQDQCHTTSNINANLVLGNGSANYEHIMVDIRGNGWLYDQGVFSSTPFFKRFKKKEHL